MHEALTKGIIKKKLFQFSTLESRCKKHQLPCDSAEKSTLYNTGASKNWKIIKNLKCKILTEKIYVNLYLVYYEAQMKIPGILKYHCPLNENINRMKTAVNETRDFEGI